MGCVLVRCSLVGPVLDDQSSIYLPERVLVVWSLVGPVPDDDVEPALVIQLKSSDVSCAQPHISTSNVHAIPPKVIKKGL